MNTIAPVEDPRRGKPSASHTERLALCPGSWALERTLPPEPESEDASTGTRIHNALAGFLPMDQLTTDEQETAEACIRLEDEAKAQVFGPGSTVTISREVRLWRGDSFSGQLDFIARDGQTALILDYKTGRGDVMQADGNLQLMAQAVLLWTNKPGLTRITVGIAQPWVSPQLTLCSYDADAIIAARHKLTAILATASQPNAVRQPGEKQCKYCRAKAVCHEALGTAMTVLHKPSQEVVALTGQELAQHLDRIPMVEAVIEALRVEAKRRLTEGEAVPGWKLKPGSERTTITDSGKVFARFSKQGGSVSDFLGCITVAKGKLKDALKQLTGAKGKALDNDLSALLEGCVETKASAPSLEREAV